MCPLPLYLFFGVQLLERSFPACAALRIVGTCEISASVKEQTLGKVGSHTAPSVTAWQQLLKRYRWESRPSRDRSRYQILEAAFYNMSWLLFILVGTVSQGKGLEVLIYILVCSAALYRPIRRVVTRSLLHPDGSAVSAVIGFFPQERK